MLTFRGVISKIETMSDRTLRLKVDTQEMEPERRGLLVNCHLVEGIFAFDPQEIVEAEIEHLPAPMSLVGKPSKSQKLRHILYRLWEQDDAGGRLKFEQYYDEMMDKIITHYKGKLS